MMNFMIYDEAEWRKIYNKAHQYEEDFVPADTNSGLVSIEMAEIGDATRFYQLTRIEWEQQGGE